MLFNNLLHRLKRGLYRRLKFGHELTLGSRLGLGHNLALKSCLDLGSRLLCGSRLSFGNARDLKSLESHYLIAVVGEKLLAEFRRHSCGLVIICLCRRFFRFKLSYLARELCLLALDLLGTFGKSPLYLRITLTVLCLNRLVTLTALCLKCRVRLACTLGAILLSRSDKFLRFLYRAFSRALDLRCCRRVLFLYVAVQLISLELDLGQQTSCGIFG